MSQILKLLSLLFLITMVMGTQCHKDVEDFVSDKQSFKENVSIFPAQKIYNVNDTIWLRFTTTDKTLYDTVSKQRLPASSIKFHFGATLLPKFETPVNPTDGFCDFVLPSGVVESYVTNQSGTAASFEAGCDNVPGYNIEFGVVLKYQGVYVLNLPDGMRTETCNNQTSQYAPSLLRFVYNVADCNKDIYLSIPASSRKEFPEGFTEAQIDYKVAYALKVQ